MEFFCHYCKLWITDTVHEQHFHNDLDEPDERRDWRVRVDGVIYEDEEEFEGLGGYARNAKGGE
jgi:hypothetical protein